MPNQLDRILAARIEEQMQRPLQELLKMGEGTRVAQGRGPDKYPRSSPYTTRGKGRARCRKTECVRFAVVGDASRMCRYHLEERQELLASGDKRFKPRGFLTKYVRGQLG